MHTFTIYKQKILHFLHPILIIRELALIILHPILHPSCTQSRVGLRRKTLAFRSLRLKTSKYISIFFIEPCSARQVRWAKVGGGWGTISVAR